MRTPQDPPYRPNEPDTLEDTYDPEEYREWVEEWKRVQFQHDPEVVRVDPR